MAKRRRLEDSAATRSDDSVTEVEAVVVKLWSVLLVHFLDDYKARGSDWSRNEGPYFFGSEKKAQTFLRHKLLTWLGDHDIEVEVNRKSLKEVEDLVTRHAEGEFVPRQIEWVLREAETMDDADEAQSSDDEEEEEEEDA